MEDVPTVDVAAVREAAMFLARALDAAGAPDAAGTLREAAGTDGPLPEQLLVLRSALIASRNRWETLTDSEATAAGHRALAAAKRLAIDL